MLEWEELEHGNLLLFLANGFLLNWNTEGGSAKLSQ